VSAGRGLATLLLLCFFTFFLGLGSQGITDSDEAYYAEASREMVETGDWLTPRFNYENRWQKPVLYYWLTAAVYRVTGPTEFAARFWSALSGAGLALLAWAMARHASGRLDIAWLSGAIVATSFGYFAMARAALPDLPLTFFITMGIWAALRAADAAHASLRLRWWALAGLGAGLGFLMKGPVAFAVPAVVLLPIAWRERRRIRIDASGILVAALVAAAVGLPWYVAMWLEHGTPYLQSFFIGDNFERFATERFNDARPFWFYLPVLLGGLMPWSMFLVWFTGGGLRDIRRRASELADSDWRLIIWAVLPLLFYTISIGKQPRYILPILPPLAILIARGILDRIAAAPGTRGAGLRGPTWATAAVYALLAVLFARMQPLMINAYPAATWIGVCLVGCAAIALSWIAMTAAWRRLPTVAVVAATVVLVSVQLGALAGRRPEAVEQLAALIRTHRHANEPIGVADVFTRNIGFYAGAPRVELFDPKQVEHFLRSPHRVLLILRSADVKAAETASAQTLTTLGQAQYLNTANVRLRTLLWPDPLREIEMISLVSNR
jgi:4-amino-4-deoxy-L-arabinose transferase-like glycosyltransferase